MNAQQAVRIKVVELTALRHLAWTTQAFLEGEADRNHLRAALADWLRARAQMSKLAFTPTTRPA